jgi:hypothetical protein
MLYEGEYDVLEFPLPTSGMNQNVSPQLLTSKFAFVLENILPMPLGKGRVRYGTRLMAGVSLPAGSTILETFPYAKTNGDRQSVLYTQVLTADLSVTEAVVVNQSQFSFKSDTPEKYAAETAVEVIYTSQSGIGNVLTSLIVAVNTNGDNVTTITVANNSFPDEDNLQITAMSYSSGSLYVYDFQLQTTVLLKEGLSVACVPRSVTYLNTLLIFNGVDKVLGWKGVDLVEVIDFVQETATHVNRLDDTHLSFTASASFNIAHYQNNNLIQLKINGVMALQTSVVNIAQQGNTITITTADNLPQFVQNQTQLFYRDWVPRFSFMAVAHDRLWGLGEGAVGLNYRSPDQALRVYFSYKSASLTDWFNPQTKAVPSLDLSDKEDQPDNLEAIVTVGSFTAFMGRKQTYLYTGSEPLGGAPPVPGKPVFEYHSTLPVGVVHGNLVLSLANDTFFVSTGGMLSFGTLNVAKQFAVSSLDGVNPVIRENVASIMTSNRAYRACRSFLYPAGSFAGFKIGFNKVLVSLYETSLYAWSFFSGDFTAATSFMTTLDGFLYLSIGHQLYQYADTTTIAPLYGDRGGERLIAFLWALPVVHQKGKRWANKRYEIQIDYPSSFVLREDNTLSIAINGDLRKSFSLTSLDILPFKGDILKTIPLVLQARPDPNNPNPQALGMRLDEPYAYPKGRLKFASSQFLVSIMGTTNTGALVLNQIRLFGIVERSRG